MAAADLKINEEADEVIGEPKGNYPLVAQILDREPDTSIEEAGTIALLVDGVRWLGKLHALRLLRMEDRQFQTRLFNQRSWKLSKKSLCWDTFSIECII